MDKAWQGAPCEEAAKPYEYVSTLHRFFANEKHDGASDYQEEVRK